MYKIDLNCDLGESFGNYKLGMDEAVLPFMSSANVACGFHASDPVVMEKTVELAALNNVAVGAHPGFPDLQGFGRRNMVMTPAEIKAITIYQIGALQAFCKAKGLALQHVKPHGALYNMAAKDRKMADAIVEAILAVDPSLIMLAPVTSQMYASAADHGLSAAREVFADRAYEEDGSLVARGKEGAMITDAQVAAKRVVRMIKEGKVTAITGKDIDIQADSVCIHGDGPSAIAFAKTITEVLHQEGIEICCLADLK
ncbi:MAG: 5-oxoprolinase subunit PxpA [Firmicutes bacterium]|nr:5-oxoprolinase subunit PxpA [Bacillota bacterium]